MTTVKTRKGTELPLMTLQGKSYLQVAHRILWFREDHPFGRIDTKCIESNDKYVIYFAEVSIRTENGELCKVSDGVKREDYSHFKDAHEKAQTGSIGRALALCGYGTQFTDDLEEGDRIADAPVQTVRPGPRAVYPDKPAIQDGIQMSVDDLGDYIIQIGQKYKGRKLKEVSIDELQSFVNWLDAESEKNRKPHAPKTLEFINHAARFIAHMEQEWAKEAGSRG